MPQEEFLTAFGMVRAARTPTALYMRGTDPVHHIHVTEKGDPRFIGFAWLVASEDDLKAAAKLPGASGIETIDEPGGGTAGPADRTERLHDRDRARDRGRAADPRRASADQLRRRSR